MSAYIDFEYDFIERTLKNIESYKDDFDTTNLINCAVGLIMIPQSLHYDSIEAINIDDLDSKFGIRKSNIKYIKPEREELRDGNYTEYNLRNIVNHIRNSIAHGRVRQEIVTEGVIESLEFIDKLGDNETLNMTISVENFKKFSIALAKLILANKS